MRSAFITALLAAFVLPGFAGVALSQDRGRERTTRSEKFEGTFERFQTRRNLQKSGQGEEQIPNFGAAPDAATARTRAAPPRR